VAQWPRSFKARSGWVTMLWVALTAIVEGLLEWAEVIELPDPLAPILPTVVGAVRFWFCHQRTKFTQP